MFCGFPHQTGAEAAWEAKHQGWVEVISNPQKMIAQMCLWNDWFGVFTRSLNKSGRASLSGTPVSCIRVRRWYDSLTEKIRARDLSNLGYQAGTLETTSKPQKPRLQNSNSHPSASFPRSLGEDEPFAAGLRDRVDCCPHTRQQLATYSRV